MAIQNAGNLAAMAQLSGKLALELVFAEPAKDNGLLPLNYLLSQLEDLAVATPPPPEIQRGLRLARKWVDEIFNTTGLFTTESIKYLGQMSTWLECALEKAAEDQPIPPLPAELQKDTAPTANSIAPATAAAPTEPAPSQALEAEESIHLEHDQDMELLREFISEAHEHLQNIELGVLVLEEKPTDKDTLNSIFRAFHTFKGGSGLLNLKPVNHLAHELESLLDLARQHKLQIDRTIIELILAGGDILKQFTVAIERQLNGETPITPISFPTQVVIARVRSVLSNQAAQGASPSASEPAESKTLVVTETKGAPEGDTQTLSTTDASNQSRDTTTSSSSFVKVATPKLDSLVDLVGEMVIAQSQVSQDPTLKNLAHGRLQRNLAQLNRITNDLQRIAMSLRMVPIRSTFQKMNRLVRDLALKQGKSVELRLHGEETELDRTIVEQLNDPLVHMIRNSVDHGIELPERRTERGKATQGIIELSAWHQGGNIVIQIKDDGGGLNKEKILAKAVERGLIKPDDNLTEHEIYQLIFEPGFSTAEKVTDVSGRGVGMDVVRRNIEKLRGKIEIQSELGVGSSFTIFLPLTLAIIDGLLVAVGENRYIIPALLVLESFRPSPQMISTVYGRGEMISVRGRLCPLLRLHDYFGIEPRARDIIKGVVIVVGAGQQTRCLLVDELVGKQEVVIKSLGETFKRNKALAGAAILGDGRVGLILDVDYLVKLKGDSLMKAA